MTKPYPKILSTIKVPRFSEEAGFYTTKSRSKQMSRIRGKDTKPEMSFRKALYKEGVRFRVHSKKLLGSPDVSNVSKKFVVFIDGEFWHGDKWEEKRNQIKTNREFWIPKIERNMQRDREVTAAYEQKGFKVFRFWDKEVKKNVDGCVALVLGYLNEER